MAEGRPPAADEIEVHLQRAYPGVVEKGELAELTGLTNDELRDGLAALRDEGRLDEEHAEGYALAMQGVTAPPSRAPEPPQEERQPSAAAEVDNAAALRVPGGGPSFRATYVVSVAFSGARGSQEARVRAARDSARTLEREIGDAILEGVGVAVSIELSELAAFEVRPIPLTPNEEGGNGSDGGRSTTHAAPGEGEPASVGTGGDEAPD